MGKRKLHPHTLLNFMAYVEICRNFQFLYNKGFPTFKYCDPLFRNRIYDDSFHSRCIRFFQITSAHVLSIKGFIGPKGLFLIKKTPKIYFLKVRLFFYCRYGWQWNLSQFRLLLDPRISTFAVCFDIRVKFLSSSYSYSRRCECVKVNNISKASVEWITCIY